ncbi:hypothetical protein [Ensifer sp. LC163]|nr:hypothetical protein [Ensifer sp. LC163]
MQSGPRNQIKQSPQDSNVRGLFDVLEPNVRRLSTFQIERP